MKNKNVVIASVATLVLIGTLWAADVKTKSSNEVAKVPTVSAGVPLTVELPFLFTYSQKTVIDSVLKPQEIVKPLPIPTDTIQPQEVANATTLTSNVQKDGVKDTTPKATPITVEQVPVSKVKEDSFKAYDIPLNADLQKYISDLCKQYDISLELMLALAKVESEYNINLISPTDDYGLFQINRVNHQDLKVALKKDYGIDWNWRNPYHNALASIYHINQLKQELGTNDASTMLVAYNMGIGNANKYLKNHSPYDWAYVRKVMDYKLKLEKGESIGKY